MDIIIKKIAKELGLKESQVKDTINLIDEGNTIPFIARYRKEVTGGISDEVLRDFDERLKYLRNLEERKSEVIRIIEEQGKLTEELKNEIIAAEMLQKVEDLYRPFKQKKSTRATKAKERGLEPLADLMLAQEITSGSLEEYAVGFINAELGVETIEDAYNGAKDIIAEKISDDPKYREYIRGYFLNNGTISSSGSSDEPSVYDMYFEYSESVKTMPNHRILAVNRGEKEKVLKVKININDDEVVNYLKSKEILNKSIFEKLIEEAVEDSYKRLVFPSVEREVRSMLTERAEEEAIKVFAKNTKPLLMIAPVKDVNVLAIDPSYRTGCKLSALDGTGKLLEYTTIYPNEPQNKVVESKIVLKKLIIKHDIDIISIGNGTASRETEQLVASLLSEISGELKKKVYYTIVSEAGASVYSASKLGTEEYPDIDVSIRGAISIGRRLQDPLAELVKIDPKSIGVGQYQHDLNQKKLGESLANVVEDCVNSVGVDLNTASPSLLNYVSGISGGISKSIVTYREENGKFKNREDLKKVKRLGDKVFEQCAGFLRISDGENPFDNTAVHPESYELARKILETLEYSEKDLFDRKLDDIEKRIADLGKIEKPKQKMLGRGKGFDALKNFKIEEAVDDKKEFSRKLESGFKELADKLSSGVPTIKDIVAEIKKPGRDPRDEMPKPVFRSDVLKMEDLQVGMILKGTVRNVIDFGAFVDIGVKQDGLVHISELSDKFVRNPMNIVSVGDIVDVKIIDIDFKKGKIALSMKGLKAKK